MGILTKPINIPCQDILHYAFPSDKIPTWTVQETNAPDETINVPEYTNSELTAAYAQYIADVPVKEAAEKAEEEFALISEGRPSLFHGSGRAYIKKNEWVTGADDQYGYGYYQNSEKANKSSTPLIEWEHMGLFLPAGCHVKRLHVVGRCNSSSIPDVEIYAGVKTPNPMSRWESGIDSDAEVSFNVLHHANFMYPTTGTQFTGNLADMHRRTIDLDHTVNEDCMFMFYLRSTINSSSTRYFYHTWTLEVY